MDASMEKFEGMAKASLASLKKIQDALSLEGKAAIVSGGAAGLGYNIVNRLCEAGAKTVIVDINAKLGEQAVVDFTELGYDVAYAKTDVSSVSDVYAAVDFTVGKYGKVDILVNCAALQSMSTFLDMPENLYDRTLDINLKGTYFLSQAAARYMVKNNISGKIVNIASDSAVSVDTPVGLHTHYNASKGAVVTLTIGMARELAQYGIQVNSVAPGGMNTYGGIGSAMKSAAVYPDLFSKLQFNPPKPAAKTPDEVALMVYLLATDASDFMVGETVYVDGGARFDLIHESLSNCLK